MVGGLTTHVPTTQQQFYNGDVTNLADKERYVQARASLVGKRGQGDGHEKASFQDNEINTKRLFSENKSQQSLVNQNCSLQNTNASSKFRENCRVSSIQGSPDQMSTINLSNLQNSTQTLGQQQEDLLHDQCNKTLQAKDQLIQTLKQQIKQLSKDKNSLEAKLEGKVAELGELKVQLGAANILQRQLKEKEDEIKKLNIEFHEAKKGRPIDPHKYCQIQFKEQKEESEALFTKLMNRIDYLHKKYDLPQYNPKNNSDVDEDQHTEQEKGQAESESQHSNQDMGDQEDVIIQIDTKSRQQLCDACGSMLSSDNHLQYCELGKQAQENLDYELAHILQQEINEKMKQTAAETICKLCNMTVFGPAIVWVSESVVPRGALTEHYKECSWILNYNQRLQEVGHSSIQVQSDIRLFFEEASRKLKQTPCPELKNELVDKAAVWSTQQFASGVLEHVLFTLTEEGDIVVPAWLPLSKEGFKTYYEPENFDALHQQVFDYRDDADILGIKKILKKRQRSRSPEKRRDEIAVKRFKGQELTLDEKRAEEAEVVKVALKEHQPDMLHIKDWLTSNFKDQLSKQKFKKLGGMFCDGIILPRLAQLFPKYNHYEAFLRGCDIQVQKISPAQVEGCIYVRLEDSANEFTKEFAVAVENAILKLRGKLVEHIKTNEEPNKKQIEGKDGGEVCVEDIYIRQIDCTQDLLGFFFTLDQAVDHKKLAKLIGIPQAHRNDYKSFLSCLYFLEKDQHQQKQLRFKIYNKWLHFLQSEQAKKKVSMGLKSLLLGSNGFYQKHLKAMKQGITRLEFSSYFYSYAEQKRRIDVQQFQQRIDDAFAQVNTLSNKINYKVPFTDMWSSFWQQARSIFVLQDNTLTVVYAKNPISTFVGQPVKINSKKDVVDFIKRFAVPGTQSIVVDTKSNQTYRVMKKGKRIMQIPIQSLNSKHAKKFPFEFDESIFRYYLEDEQLKNIELVLANGELFILNDGNSDIVNQKREKKAEKKDLKKGIDATDLLKEARTKDKKRIKVFNEFAAQLYGNVCQFSSKDKGISYNCNHCARTIKAQGKLRKPLLFLT